MSTLRTLAIECATEACSLALFENGALVDSRHEILGRGHAERLVPLIATLPDKGRAADILVSLGPGSFTGVRIGLAAARALGLAWGATVRGYPTLALVAAASPQEPCTIVMRAGHGEWFVQNFGAGLVPEDDVRSLAPEAAVDAARHRVLSGDRVSELADLVGANQITHDRLPDARDANALPERLLRTDLTPIYGRAPDARLPG